MLNWLRKILPSQRSARDATALLAADPDSNARAVSNRVGQSAAHKSDGDASLRKGDWIGAANSYQQALSLTPDSPGVHNNLAFVLIEQGRLPEARHHLETAIRLDPALFEPYFFLGTIAEQRGELDEAIRCFENALAAKPDFAEALENLGRLERDRGMVRESASYFRRALAINPLAYTVHSGLLFTLQYGSDLTQAELFSEHKNFAWTFGEQLNPSLPVHSNNRDPERRLKIGYVSSDFRAHSVALFMLPVLSRHDARQVEIFCYYNSSSQDALTERFKSLSDHFVFCEGLSDSELEQRIRADEIDILVDLNGHTGNHRLLAFSRKPAPVQVSYLGYIATTGLSAIDYRFTNVDAEPVGSDAFYSESLFRFTDHLWWCYRPADDLPDITPLPARANGFVTFVSANNIAKISDANVKVWSEILHALPDSRLMLMSIPVGIGQEVILRRFAGEGIAADRLLLRGKMSLGEFRNCLLQADIALDTFPFNGGTTSCETLWLGLPIVAMIGDAFRSRMSYAILKSIGLPELAGSNEADYVRVAVELARNPEYLSTLRDGMRARLMSSPLSDEVKFTRGIEAAYREMWTKYLQREA